MVDDFFLTLALISSLAPATRREIFVHRGVTLTRTRSVARSDSSNKTGANKNETANLADERTCGEPRFPVRSPVKIAPNWSEAKRTRTQPRVHKPRGFSTGGESRWLVANERICGCYSYACTRDAQPPWGHADDPEAKRTAMLSSDAMTGPDRDRKKELLRKCEDVGRSQLPERSRAN